MKWKFVAAVAKFVRGRLYMQALYYGTVNLFPAETEYTRPTRSIASLLTPS